LGVWFVPPHQPPTWGIAPLAPYGARSQGRAASRRPQERIQRLVTEGRKTREEVEHAEEFWHDRLRSGVHLPNGDLIQIRRAVQANGRGSG
jgi:hypothetical protein